MKRFRVKTEFRNKPARHRYFSTVEGAKKHIVKTLRDADRNVWMVHLYDDARRNGRIRFNKPVGFEELTKELMNFESETGITTVEWYAKYVAGELEETEENEARFGSLFLYLGTEELQHVTCLSKGKAGE